MIKDDILGYLQSFPEDSFSLDDIFKHFTTDPRYHQLYAAEVKKMFLAKKILLVDGKYRIAPTGLRLKVLDRMSIMGWAEPQTAERAGVDATRLKRWLCGANTLGPDDLGKVAAALGGKLVIDIVF